MPNFYKKDCGNSEANRQYYIEHEEKDVIFYAMTNKTHSEVHRFGEVTNKNKVNFKNEIDTLPNEIKSDLPQKLEGENGTILLL